MTAAGASPWDDALGGWRPNPAEVSLGVRITAAGPTGASGIAVVPDDARGLGWSTTLSDLLLGRALLAALGPGWSCVTLSLRSEWTATVLAGVGALAGSAQLVDVTGDVALVHGRVHDAAGRSVALVSGRFKIFRGERQPPAGLASSGSAPSDGCLTRVLGMAPRGHAQAERVVWALPRSRRFANPSDVVHGGVQAAALVCVAEDLAAAVGAGARWRVLDLDVHYRRALAVADESAEVVGFIKSRSRSVLSVDLEVVDAEGVLLTAGSCMLARVEVDEAS
ncbi:hypothetical protein [Microbacterium sp. No. 7]|uniref:hypothetical protein n=1 Tax=Microbacterium sp. No. 7 TaxID=1714373 RepID=UPI000B232778|nr:hypothetical protein [Microbacterium sp. No. 7]